MKGLLTLLALAGLAAGVFALGKVRSVKDDKPILNVADEVALTVSTAKPMRERIIRLVQAPGDVEPVLEVEISSEIVSKIEEMPIEEGDVVKKGQLLCRLDDDNLLADLDSGKARIAQLGSAIANAQVDLEKTRRDLDRQERLSESNATSDLEMQDHLTLWKKAKSSYEMRQHELTEAEAMLKRVEENLKRTVITSPIDGVIAKLSAKQGEVVITGTMNNPGTVIMVISDLSKMQIRARVDEVDVPLVRPDQKARIFLQSDSNVPVPARVVRVASKGTKLTGRDVVTFETLLEVLSTEERIKPGMTANVEIEVADHENAITVPVEAVVHRMRKDLPKELVADYDKKQSELDLSDRARQAQYIKVIYIMDGEKARVRLVEPGIADTRRVELRDGVSMDDVIITGPYRSLDQLEEGKKVALAEKDKKEQEEAGRKTDGQEVAEKDEKSGDQGQEEKQDKTGDDKSDDKDDDKAVATSTAP